MSVRATKRTELIPPALDLLEEAVALLRQVPISIYVPLLCGLIPWVAGLLLFWSYTTWFAPSSETIAWMACGLALCFTHLKVCQAHFSHRLLEFRRGDPAVRLSVRTFFLVAGQQLRVQTWGLLALPLASVVAFPLGWVMAFYQTDTVLAFSTAQAMEGKRDTAWKLAQYWPMQNHQALSLLSLAGFVAWINMVACFFLIPYLAIHLLGLRTFLGVTTDTLFNSSLAAATFLVSWACLDPLFKAFYVLRVYYGQARSTGADLRQRFVGGKRLGGGVGLSIFLMGLLVLGSGRTLNAAELDSKGQPTNVKSMPAGSAVTTLAPVAVPRVVNPAAMDRTIDQLLKDSDFAWRLRPRPEALVKAEQSDHWLVRFLDKGVKAVRMFLDYLGDLVRRLIRLLMPSRDADSSKVSSGLFGGAMVFLSWLLIIVLGLLLIWLIVKIVDHIASTKPAVAVQSGQVLPVLPDLEDETVHAAQLPEQEWLRLARERLEAKEWRLACRALFLAQLARLGADGLIRLARHKTNGDYERELKRRVGGEGAAPMVSTFPRHRKLFDLAWYGRREVPAAELGAWLSSFEERRSP